MAKGKKKKRSGHPARSSPAPARRPAEDSPALSRKAVAIGVLVLLVAGIGAILAAGSGDEPEQQAVTDPQDLPVPWTDEQGVTPIVGSVDVNPADDSVWLSTNTGMWRVPPDGGDPE